MRVVSRDVIEHSSQTRVISSERRHPSVGDIPNRCGTRTDPFRMFRDVTAIPAVAPAWSVSVRDEWSSSTVHRVSPTVDSLPLSMNPVRCTNGRPRRGRLTYHRLLPIKGGELHCSTRFFSSRPYEEATAKRCHPPGTPLSS